LLHYEHEFIYAEANIGSRSAYIDLTTGQDRDRPHQLLSGAHLVVNNHRSSKLEYG
jgi:crotonobetainyl-CoA:carnitine CoA-transferase CaiB-like acyl-CoA transferase